MICMQVLICFPAQRTIVESRHLSQRFEYFSISIFGSLIFRIQLSPMSSVKTPSVLWAQRTSATTKQKVRPFVGFMPNWKT